MNIRECDVSRVTNMSNMFHNCYKFNQYIGDWNICNISNIDSIFDNCFKFNYDIIYWDTIRI